MFIKRIKYIVFLASLICILLFSVEKEESFSKVFAQQGYFTDFENQQPAWSFQHLNSPASWDSSIDARIVYFLVPPSIDPPTPR